MENIEVLLRIRPISSSEQFSDIPIWEANNNTVGIPNEKYDDLVRARKLMPGLKNVFNFNLCFDQAITNYDIYEQSVKRIALSGLQGINGTVFMYGQTGSGKTYTMMGNKFNIRPTQLNTASSMSKDKFFGMDTIYSKTATRLSFENTKAKRNIVSVNEFSDRSPLDSKSKTPTRGDNISNIQIDLNNLLVESDERRFENEKNNFKNFVLPNSEANPLYSRTNDATLFSERGGNQEGILQMALRNIFEEIEKQPEKRFFIRCSYLEIYTDQIFDLLKEQHEMHETLTINEDLNKEFYVKGAKDEIVSSVEDVMAILRKGENNRHYASTAMNHCSSRSHTLFRMFLQGIPDSSNGSKDIFTESILNFVDLAGSEKISIHDDIRKKARESSAGHYSSNTTALSSSSSGNNIFKDRVNESKHINKSLFFLTQVISLKSQGKSDLHIPFRNSPLTKILRSSLGGNSRTSIILCINPCLSQYEQSLSTIRFGLNAKKIENQIHRNIITSNNDEMIKNMIYDYEKKIHDMEKEKIDNKSKSEELLSVIQKLQEQKSLIEHRLAITKNTENFNKKAAEEIKAFRQKKNENIFGDYLHVNNVGILHFNMMKAKVEKEFKFDSEGKYAVQGMNLMREQKTIMEKKITLYRENIDELEDKKRNLIELSQNLEAQLNQTKNENFLLIKEKEKLIEKLNLYQNKNTDSLKKISLQNLSMMERNLTSLLENIKVEKIRQMVLTHISSISCDKYDSGRNLSKNPEYLKPLISEIVSESFSQSLCNLGSQLEINEIFDLPKNTGLNYGDNLVFKRDSSLNEKNIESSFVSSGSSFFNKEIKEYNDKNIIKDYLGQIKIEKNVSKQEIAPIDSFQTYFDKETFKKDSDFAINEQIMPLDRKLEELNIHFQNLKVKIVENNVGNAQPYSLEEAECKVSEVKKDSSFENSQFYENLNQPQEIMDRFFNTEIIEKNFDNKNLLERLNLIQKTSEERTMGEVRESREDKIMIKNANPQYLSLLQNKENLNFTKKYPPTELNKNIKPPLMKRAEELSAEKKKAKTMSKPGSFTNFSNSFERHVEYLKNNQKLMDKI